MNIQDIVEASVTAAKLVAQGIQAIMDSNELNAEQKAEAIRRIEAEQDQDTKDLDAMPLPESNVPPPKPTAR